MPDPQPAIDRKALLARHAVEVRGLDVLASLTVGNGEFAFTVDATGLQSFPELYEGGVPLGTQAQWGWGREPNPEGWRLEDAFNTFEVAGRRVPYPEASPRGGPGDERRARAVEHLRRNPHRLDLAKLGLALDGEPLAPDRISGVSQRLDLGQGLITSRFRLDGEAVEVLTAAHPTIDAVGVRINSPLLASGRLALLLRFPNASIHFRFAWSWEGDTDHESELLTPGPAPAFRRRVAGATYVATLDAPLRMEQRGRHAWLLRPEDGARVLELGLEFAQGGAVAPAPGFPSITQASSEHWEAFWARGAALELADSPDPRAVELERRVVLSQYLTAVQCAGSTPPQETGLTTNSWHGKFHLEMHWWHAAQFTLWDRPELLARSMGWYHQALPVARDTARRQGYAGARWPKMVGPDAVEAPSDIGVFLIWQQPHPIHLCELLYRSAAAPEAVLREHQELVFATAEFMADFPLFDADGRASLAGPLMPSQESYRDEIESVRDPTFELAYWWWALDVAQRWRARLGLPPHAEWERVKAALPAPAPRGGVYPTMQSAPFTRRDDHPSMVAALGVVPPTPLIDHELMAATLASLKGDWDWSTAWGWDFPMMAMTAARLGRPEDAVDMLMMDAAKNRYLVNGHNFQHPYLPLYLPGNGGLLYATAMMARGFDGAEVPHPGFPSDRWTVRMEGGRLAP